MSKYTYTIETENELHGSILCAILQGAGKISRVNNEALEKECVREFEEYAEKHLEPTTPPSDRISFPFKTTTDTGAIVSNSGLNAGKTMIQVIDTARAIHGNAVVDTILRENVEYVSYRQATDEKRLVDMLTAGHVEHTIPATRANATNADIPSHCHQTPGVQGPDGVQG